jgi:RimJ/RimL family protein N-acetyltransferase
MTRDEVSLLHRWVNDPEIMPFWYGRDRPMSVDDLLADWKPYYFDGSAPRLGRCFAIEADDRPIGMIAYNAINERDRSVEIDIVIGETEYWDRGYGTDAIRAFLGCLFGEMGLHRVWILPSVSNPRAVRCYEKAGFVREGVLRDHSWFEGHWQDCVMMSVLDHECRGQEG